MGQSQATVLVVDDQLEVLEQLSAVLNQAGYACLTACTRQAAKEILASATPSLLIVNANLGGESGLELAEELRAVCLPTTCVMFMTASQGPDVIRRRNRATGMTAYYLRKPFAADVLLPLVEKGLAAELAHA